MSAFFANHWLEIAASLAGLLNIYLLARVSLWNWFFGMVTVILYAIIFFQVKLYAEMGLQIIFLGFQFYGWYQWTSGKTFEDVLPIRQATLSNWIICSLVFFLLFCFITFILKNFSDSTTIYIDAFITALSLVAQWLMSKKYLEHWWLWIVVNCVSIEIYVYKQLYLTAGLYFIFLILCILGYQTWKSELKKVCSL